MSTSRPFRPEDIPAVVALHRRAFPRESVLPTPELEHDFEEVFFRNPWRAGACPSLVCQDSADRIVGFIGVVPRAFRFNGRPLRAIVPTQLMVEPGGSAGLVAISLLREVFQRPEDLVLADGASEVVRRIWMQLGGAPLWLQSLCWIRPLRPARYVGDVVARYRPGMTRLTRLLRPAAAVGDALAARLKPNRWPKRSPRFIHASVDARDLVADLREFYGGRALCPDYDEASLGWLFARLRAKRGSGTLTGSTLKDERGRTVGWFLYYLSRTGASEVLSLAAKPGMEYQVLQELFLDAWRRGAVAVAGTVDTAFLASLGESQCVFSRAVPWALCFTRRPEILYALDRGDALLSRLEGEFWSRFLGG